MIWIALVAIIVGAILVWARLGAAAERKARAAGEYARLFVFVEEDGSARELTADERDHLNGAFHPADGARPYIKSRYRELTPDGKTSGYLRRNKLPAKAPAR